MNTQFNANVYAFTEEIFKDLVNNFEGKVVGGDGLKVEDIMKHFFADFVPDKENLVEEELAPPPKGKAKKVKDPSKPKKAKSSFFYYVDTIRKEVKDANPDKKLGELSKIHSEMWDKVKGTDEATQFIEMANKDKERYMKEMELWKEKNDSS